MAVPSRAPPFSGRAQLARALTRKPEPIEWDEEKAKPTETSVTTEPAVETDSSVLTAH